MTKQLILVRRYKEIRKLTTRQGKDYTFGCLLAYDYIKKSLQINSSWFEQTKRARCWSNSIQQIEFVGQLKNTEAINADGTQSVFFEMFKKKNERKVIKTFSKKCNSVINISKLLRIES